MGRSQKRKGYRGEHNLEKLLKTAGLNAERVPLSGATKFAKGDVVVEGLVGEVKWRKDGFKQIYKYFEGKDLLFIKADRKPYLVVMRLEEFIELLRGAKSGGGKHEHR